MFDGRIISGITVFVAVAEAGGYARASQHLGLSRSGVGKAVGRLEERTGLRLFDRTSRALKLTDEGRAFLEEVRPLLDRLGQAARPARPDELRGRLRVTCDAAFGTYLLMPSLPELVARHPRLKVELLIRDRIDNLLAEGVDIAVRFGEPEARDLHKRLLFRSRVVTCATPAYVARHGLPDRPEALLDGHQCLRLLDDVTGRPHGWSFLNEAGEQQRIAAEGSVTVNDAPSLMAGIQSGFGIGRALDFMVEAELRAGRLVELLPDWNHATWPAYMYLPARAHRSAGLEAFKAFILSRPFATAAAISAPLMPLPAAAAPARQG